MGDYFFHTFFCSTKEGSGVRVRFGLVAGGISNGKGELLSIDLVRPTYFFFIFFSAVLFRYLFFKKCCSYLVPYFLCFFHLLIFYLLSMPLSLQPTQYLLSLALFLQNILDIGTYLVFGRLLIILGYRY